ncbi:hypothetical protein [Arthrobacter sp. GMC3]|uniref:hypothetical protein n=1 Tax=Arthrobacter sp. GMC3 TaxID=2058894 RepID=UPI0015E2C89B|nr:hypothetical protein [Arthrobacter sp. GMC3]
MDGNCGPTLDLDYEIGGDGRLSIAINAINATNRRPSPTALRMPLASVRMNFFHVAIFPATNPDIRPRGKSYWQEFSLACRADWSLSVASLFARITNPMQRTDDADAREEDDE